MQIIFFLYIWSPEFDLWIVNEDGAAFIVKSEGHEKVFLSQKTLSKNKKKKKEKLYVLKVFKPLIAINK